MKYGLTLLILSLFTLLSNASELTNEFTYIQPIAVEEAPVTKAIEVPAKENVSKKVQKTDETPKIVKVAQSDKDKDGVSDKDDKCPTTVQGATVDNNGCELDSDEDGIPDSQDKCVGTSKDFVVDGYGCPQTATLKVNFEPGKYNVSKELVNDLQNFASFLKENSGYQVLIYGYTDSIGSAVANKKLSQNRANAVKEALSRYGIKTLRMTAIGKGESNPIADNINKAGRAKNRRIEVELLQ